MAEDRFVAAWGWRLGRRFSYCLVAALALHMSPLVSQVGGGRKQAAPVPRPTTAPTEIPIDLEPAPPKPPEPLKPPEPPKPEEKKPPEPPKPPPKRERTPSSTRETGNRQEGETKLTPDEEGFEPPKKRRSKNAKDSNSFFGGKGGRFRANLCLVDPGIKSVLLSDGCEPIFSFYTNELDVSPRRFNRGFPGVRKRVEWFALHYDGRFEVTTTGYHTFRLLADDGAMLYIDGTLAIDNDGQHAPRSEKMAVPLNAGEHEFRVLYYQGPGDTLALQLFVQAPGEPERLFGPVVGKQPKKPKR